MTRKRRRGPARRTVRAPKRRNFDEPEAVDDEITIGNDDKPDSP